MSKAFLSSCDFYPDNSNQTRERNLVFFSRKNERSCYQKNQDYVIDKISPSTCDKSGNLDQQELNLPFLMSYFDDFENREKKENKNRFRESLISRIEEFEGFRENKISRTEASSVFTFREKV